MCAIFNFKDFYKRKFTCREFVCFNRKRRLVERKVFLWRIEIECIEQFSLNLNIESFLVVENFQAPFAVVESHIASSFIEFYGNCEIVGWIDWLVLLYKLLRFATFFLTIYTDLLYDVKRFSPAVCSMSLFIWGNRKYGW